MRPARKPKDGQGLAAMEFLHGSTLSQGDLRDIKGAWQTLVMLSATFPDATNTRRTIDRAIEGLDRIINAQEDRHG